MAKRKKITCVCCEEPIPFGSPDAWKSDKGYFCSENCIARWYGSPADEDDQEWEEQ